MSTEPNFRPQRVKELEGIDVSNAAGLVTNISRKSRDGAEYLVIATHMKKNILTRHEAYHDVSLDAAPLYWLELYRSTGKIGRMFMANTITDPKLQNDIKSVVYDNGRHEVDVFGNGYVVLISSYSIGD